MFRVLKTIITLLFIFELACTKVCANEFGVLSPTLTTLSTQLSTFVNSKTFTYQIFTLPQTQNDVQISINDVTYYVTPIGTTDANALNLLSIYSTNELINVDFAQDALFKYEDPNGVMYYYSYNTEKMKRSAYELIETTDEGFDFSLSYLNPVDEVGKKYYKLNLLSAYLSDHSQLSTSSSSGASDNTIIVNLPNNKVYLKYDYEKPSNYIEKSEKIVINDISTDVKDFLFKNIASSDENGGVILNASTVPITISSDFINNALINASGGAVYNIGVANVDGIFINNSINGSTISGGAILNSAFISVDAEFIKNYVKGTDVSGGALSNIAEIMLEKDAIIDVVSGCFAGNYVLATSGDGKGGAIYNSGNSLMTDTKIELVEGDFVSNYVDSTFGASYGGAIYNGNAYTFITTVEGDFISNFVSSSTNARGGAIYNNAFIEYVIGDFISNYVKSTNGVSLGGAIYNENEISSVTGNFLYNSAIGASAKGGAIYNVGQLKNYYSEFINNSTSSTNSSSEGGAIYNSGILYLNGDLHMSSNFAHSTNGESKGGAIYNIGMISGDLSGNFVENHTSSDNSSTYGGALYNNGYITNIFAKFVKSSATGKNVYGGAIYNSNSITNLKATFSDNAINSSTLSQGGVIYNKGSIYNISSTFNKNNATSSKKVYGGAIYNIGDIHYLNNDGSTIFTQNTVLSTTDKSYGGAIYNSGTILDISNTIFIDNIAKTEGVSSAGGAIYSEGYISKLNNSTFENNASLAQKGDTPVGNASGGAIQNAGTINSITSSFVNNYAIGKSAQGGAIYNSGVIIDLITEFKNNYVVSSNGYAQGGAIYNTGSFSTGIKDTSFYDNYAFSTNGNAFGGAIYTTSDLTVESTKNVLVFQGNYVQAGNNEKVYQAIYVGDSDATLTLSSLGVSKIVFFDDIDGVNGFKTLMTGDETAEINLYNKISNSQVTLENLTFKYNVDTFFGENLSLYTNSGRMEMRDSLANDYFVTELFSHENALYFIDVDPLAESIDKIVIANGASGVVTIEEINYVNKLTKDLILKVLETDSEDITISITHTVKDIVKELPNTVYNTDVFIQEEGASFHDKHTIKFLYHRRMDNLQLINEKVMVPNEEGLLDERYFIFKEDSTNDYKVLDTITSIGITTPGTLNIVGCIVNDEKSFLDFNKVEGFNLQNESILNIDNVKIVNSPIVLNLNNETAQANLTNVVLAENNVAITNSIGDVNLVNVTIEKDASENYYNNVINSGTMSISDSNINTSVENSGVFNTVQNSTNVIYNFTNSGVANLLGSDTIYEPFNNTNEVNTSGSTIFINDVVNYGIMNLSNYNQFNKLVNQSSAIITTLDSTDEQGVIFNEVTNIGTMYLNAENNVFNKNVLNSYSLVISGKVYANALIDGVGLTTVNGNLVLLENSEFTLQQELNIGDTGVLTVKGGKFTVSTTSAETDGDVLNGVIVGESGQINITNSSIFERQILITENSDTELNLTTTSFDTTMNGVNAIHLGKLSSEIDSSFKIDVNVETITNDNFIIHQDSNAVLNIVQLNGLTKDNMPRKHTIEFFILNEDTNAILYLDESPTGIIEQYKTVSKLQDFYQPDLDVYLVTSNDYIGEKGIKLGENKKSIIAGDLTGYDELNILVELPKELTADNPCTNRMFNVKDLGYSAIKSAGIVASGVLQVYGDSEDSELFVINFNKNSGFNVSTYSTNLTLRNITIQNALSTIDNRNGVGAGLTVENSDSEIIIDNVIFKNNVATFAGGAIFNNGSITEITNTSFLGNYVFNDGSSNAGEGLPDKICGGAICSLTNLTMNSNHSTTLIQGNYTQFADNEKVLDAIYMGQDTVLTLNSVQSGRFIIDDCIDGKNAYFLVLTGDATSIIELNNKVTNATVTSENITLKIAHNTFDSTNSNLTISSGVLTTEDFSYYVYTIDDLTSVDIVEYFIDFNLFVDENDVLQYSTDKFKFTNSATGVIRLSDSVLSKLGLDNRYSKLTQYLFKHKDSSFDVELIEKSPTMDIILSMTDMVVTYDVEYYQFVVKSSDFIGKIGYRSNGTTGFKIGVLSYIDSLVATNVYSNPDVKRTFIFEDNYILIEQSLGVTGEGAFDINGFGFDLDFDTKQGFNVEGDYKLVFNLDSLTFKNSSCAISNTNTNNLTSVIVKNSNFDNNDVAINNSGNVTLIDVSTVYNDASDKNIINNEGVMTFEGNNIFNSNINGSGHIFVTSGETNLLNSLVIGNTLHVNEGVIKFSENTFADSNLVINGGNVIIDDFAYKAYNIGNLTIESDFSLVIDINVNSKETDTLHVGDGSSGVITISKFSEPQVADFVERSEIKVLYKSNPADSIKLALSDELKNLVLADFTIDRFFIDDKYIANDTDYICKMMLDINDLQDSIVLKAKRDGSVLSIFNQHQHPERIFNIVSDVYTEAFDLGVTASGKMVVNGESHILDLNNHSGFIIANKDTTLAINNVYILNGYTSGNGAVINSTNFENVEINLVDASINQNASDGLGGAIYSVANLNIFAENSNVYISNNRAQDNILNDIYLDNTKNTALTLSLFAKEDKSIQILSGLDFAKTGLTININDVDYVGEVTLSGSLGTSSSKLINIFNVNGGTLSFVDNLFSNIYIKNLNINVDTKYALDVDLIAQTTDTIHLDSTKTPVNKFILDKSRFNFLTMFTKENDSAVLELIKTKELTSKFFKFESTDNDVVCYDFDGVNYFFLMATEGQLVISRDNPDYFLHPLVVAISNPVANIYEMSSDNLLYNYGSQKNNPTQNNVQSTSLTIKGNNYSIIAAYLNPDSDKLAGIAVSGGVNGLSPNKQKLIVSDVTFKEFEQAIINKGGTVKLTNVNFENNNSDANGNAIYNEIGSLTLTGSENAYAYLYNNSSSANGGAIYNSGTMTINYVDFGRITDETSYNNTAMQGGALYNTGTLISKYNNFVKNFATSKGGAIVNDGTLTLANNLFEQNSASDNGGAIYTTSAITDTSSIFESNVADKGGAIYVASPDLSKKVTLTGTQFYSNNANVDGGALYVESGSVALSKTVFGNEVSENKNKAYNGGALYNSGDLTATGASFTCNLATKEGGAIYNNGIMTLNDSIFGNKDLSSDDITFANKASSGGAIYNDNSLIIKSSDFNANIATYGAAIYNNGTLNVSETSTFTNNTSNFGGAIYNVGNAQLNTAIFSNNKVSTNIMTTSSGYGGAIYNKASGENKLVVQKSTFTGNYAEKLGGAIYNESNSNIEITSSTFTLNNTTNQGGAIYNQGLATITSTTFGKIDNEDYSLSNTANEGGAIYNIGTMSITSSNMYYNEADVYGGAIYNSAFVPTETLTITTSTLSHNRIVGANGFGGALYNKTGTVNILGSTFSYNNAGKGGGIYNDGVLVLNNSGTTQTKMLGNTAAFGGALYNNGSLNVTGALFESNVSDFAGGALLFNITPDVSKQTAYVTNTTFSKNSSDFGGGVYAIGTSATDNSPIYNTVTIANSTFVSNVASTYGGAIYADINSKITVVDTDFKNNTAGKDGGAIFINGGAEVSIIAQTKDVVFIGNTANGISNDVYLGSYVDDELNTYTAILNLQTSNGKTITFNGNIAGEGVINIYGNTFFDQAVLATDSKIVLNHVAGTLTVSNELNLSGASLSVNGTGSVNVANGAVRTLTLDNLSLADGTTSNLSLDVGLKNATSDKLQAKTVEGTGTLNVSSINVVTNSKNPVEINIGKDSVVSSISTNKAESAEATYKLKSYYDENGLLRVVAYGQKAKPSAVAAPVAAQIGGYLTQINSYDQAFMNMDMNMLKTLEERNANSSACCEDRLAYSPEFTNGINPNGKGLWNRPFATFEKVSLNNGPKVSNVGYGNYFGGDAELKEVSNGWKRQFSAYIGYNGSVQDYERQSIDQNGGTVGVTEVWYKNNFFAGLTLNAGANVAQAHTDLGRENMPMFMTGIASKTGYNFEFKNGKFIVQPSMLMSYSFIHTFAHDNGLGHRVSSSPLHAIQLAPGIKFIANLRNGWQPYFNVNMRWNLIDKTHFSIPDVTIPDMSIDPYVEYGLGLQRRWGDRFTGYGQAMIRNGGRNGVMLSFGFKWLLGE